MERDAPLLTVREFMVRSPVALAADRAIADAIGDLEAHGWSGAPVVDANRAVVGVFSESDGLRVLADAAWHGLPQGTVADHMTREVETVDPDTDVYAVAQRLRTRRVHRLPVVEDGRLVGLVTVHDVACALRRIQEARDRVHVERPPPGASWDPRLSAQRDRRRG